VRSIGPVEAAAEGRHPGVVGRCRWLDVNPNLPDSARQTAQVFTRAALDLLEACPVDTPDLTDALDLLIKAKDSGVRARIAADGGP
jgi:hypothetical protein